MARYDFQSVRLFVTADLAEGAEVALEAGQANYLLNVLRMKAGDGFLVFNGRDGEWRAALAEPKKRSALAKVQERVRAQERSPDIELCFAPLKHARLDYVVQKAVEMGAARLRPIVTRRTQVARVNLERMRANVVEAAEQCGVLHVPDVEEPAALETLLRNWPAARRPIFCDEDAPVVDPIVTLTAASVGPAALFIGPEGGFDPQERALLLSLPGIVRLSLGPRILRADTAAVAAMALVQATWGDWR